jgi:mannose-6-phosphate isomerase class I
MVRSRRDGVTQIYVSEARHGASIIAATAQFSALCGPRPTYPVKDLA